MIIHTTPLPAHQALQPDTRAHGVAPTQPVSSTPPPAGASVAATPEVVQQAVAVINQALQQSNRTLEFSVDTDTRQTVVKMVDTTTGELLRQFPSESALAIAREIEQFQQGLLIARQA